MIDRQDYKKYIGHDFESKRGYVVRDSWAAPLAASGLTTYILATQAAGATYTTMAHQPDFARLLVFVASTTNTTVAVITGTNIRDEVITENVTLNSSTPVNTLNCYKTVTSVVLPANAGTVSLGIIDSLGLSRCLSEDAVLATTVDGVWESTRPTTGFDAAVVSKNYITPNTAPNGARNFACGYLTKEIRKA